MRDNYALVNLDEMAMRQGKEGLMATVPRFCKYAHSRAQSQCTSLIYYLQSLQGPRVADFTTLQDTDAALALDPSFQPAVDINGPDAYAAWHALMEVHG